VTNEDVYLRVTAMLLEKNVHGEASEKDCCFVNWLPSRRLKCGTFTPTK